MTTRIIKNNSTSSVRVQSFAFNDIAEEPSPSVSEPVRWTEESQRPASHGAPGTAPTTAPPEALAPVVDVAQIEKQAFESGFHQGEKAGMEIAEKKMESLMQRYSETVLEIGRLKPTLYSQAEREVVRLAIEVAKKIVHREIHADREIIQTLVRVALGHVAEKSAVTIHLHPLDYNFILEHRAELNQGSDGQDIVLLADKAIDRGGCLIQTECGDIDARIEEEFREVERAFSEGMR